MSYRKRKAPSYAQKTYRSSKYARGYGGRRITYSTLRRRGLRSRGRRLMNLRTAGFLGVEKKFYDTSLVASAIPAPTDATGGEFDPSATSMVSTPAQGDGEQNRDGKQIACLYLEIKGQINCLSVEGAVDPYVGTEVFVACVLDSQSNGAQLNSEDVFKNTGANAVLATTPVKNLLFGKRFRILKQKCFTLTSNALSTAGANNFAYPGVIRHFSWYIPLNGLKINFNAGTTSSIANVIDNSIHIIAYATSTAATPTISYNARLRFVG